jgi:hypothetical protein
MCAPIPSARYSCALKSEGNYRLRNVYKSAGVEISGSLVPFVLSRILIALPFFPFLLFSFCML